MTAVHHAHIRARYGLAYHALLCEYLIALSAWQKNRRILSRAPDPFYDERYHDETKKHFDPKRIRIMATLTRVRRVRQPAPVARPPCPICGGGV